MASHIQLWDQDLQSRAIVAYSVLKRLQIQTPKGAKKSTLAPNVPLVRQRYNGWVAGWEADIPFDHVSLILPRVVESYWHTQLREQRICTVKLNDANSNSLIDSRTKFWNANTMKCFPSTLFFDPRVWLNRGQLHCKRRDPKLRTGSRRHAFVWSTKNIKKL